MTKKYSDIKPPKEKQFKVFINKRHPHIRSWESMLAEAKTI